MALAEDAPGQAPQDSTLVPMKGRDEGPPQEGGGSVLTCQELKEYGVIQNADNSSYQITSYDLRLGSCHYVYENPWRQENNQWDSDRWRLIHIGSDEELRRLNGEDKIGQQYETPKTARHQRSDRCQRVVPPHPLPGIDLGARGLLSGAIVLRFPESAGRTWRRRDGWRREAMLSAGFGGNLEEDRVPVFPRLLPPDEAAIWGLYFKL